MGFRLRPGKDARMHDRSAGVDQPRRITLCARQPPIRVDEEIRSTAVAGRLADFAEHQEDIHARRVPFKGEAFEVRAIAVDPEGVGVQDVERILADQGQRLDDAAGRIEQEIALVGDNYARCRAAFEMADDLVGQVVDVHNRPRDASRGQGVEAPIEKRAAGNLDQRLGNAVGDRTHALSQPGRQDHRRCGTRHASSESSPCAS